MIKGPILSLNARKGPFLHSEWRKGPFLAAGVG